MKQLNNYFPIVLVIVLSIFAIKPLLGSGFYPMHDNTQVVRVYEMKTALQDGLFPVRWVPDLGYGYGYPLFNFYAPLAYYIGAFITMFGFDSLLATKLMIAAGVVIAGISMYYFAKEFWGKAGAIVSALLYLYAPYHAVNIYVRGAIAELWAYALVPFVFLGLYKIFLLLAKPKKTLSLWKWISFAAVSYAAVIISHNLTAFMVTPFLFLFAVLLTGFLYKKKINSGYWLFISLFIGVLLAAFYWLPATLEMKYTNVLSVVGGGSDYKDHFVCLSQLWNNPWGYGGSAPGCMDGMSYKIGKMHLLLGALSLIVLFFKRSKRNLQIAVAVSFVGFFTAVFLLLGNSKFIWDMIPQMAFFQFPWRFLILAMFFLSFLGGAILVLIPKVPKVVLVVVLSIVIIYTSRTIFVPSKILPVTADYYTNQSSLTWITSKISDEYMPQHFSIPKKENEVPKQKIIINNANVKTTIKKNTTQQLTADITSPKTTQILLNIAYFPSWHVFLDTRETQFSKTNKGLLINVPSGTHEVTAKLIQTPIEQIANSLSLTGVIALLTGIIYMRKRTYDQKKS